MKDLEIEYYLGILAILGIELYSSGNTTKIKNNVLKGGSIIKRLRGLPNKGETRLTPEDKATIRSEYGIKARSLEDFNRQKEKKEKKKKEKYEKKKEKERKKNLKKEDPNKYKQEKYKAQAETEKKQIERRNEKKKKKTDTVSAKKTAAVASLANKKTPDVTKEKSNFSSSESSSKSSSGFELGDSSGMVNNFFSPSWILIGCLIIACIAFILFMGAPSIIIISLLVASWYFLRNQINRYFPAVDSNPVMKSNNQNQN